jgi:hemolysin III
MAQAPYSPPEERLHILLHSAGFGAGLVAIPWLIYTAAASAYPARMVGAIVFGLSAMMMLATSTFYHRSTESAPRARWRMLDHAAIYVLIAGTYTPFTIGVMRDPWGWILFAIVWAIALLGIIAKTTLGFRYPRLSTALYVLMGWAGIVAIKPMIEALSTATLAWIGAGGLLYMLGVPFYVWKSRRYTHAVWHLLVLGGVACHFMAVRNVLLQAS